MRPILSLLSPLFILLATLHSGSAQDRISVDTYVQRYKQLAVDQMEIYGIPASIKLAQGLHESDSGNSRLARQANNHFGIKCKSDWTGQTITHTDDAPDECFRKYESVEASFLDHSEFLDQSARYQELFKLNPTDYRGWAYGLKQAGYATNPKYAEILIRIIEENKLFLLDQGEDIASGTLTEAPEQEVEVAHTEAENTLLAPVNVVDVDNYSISVNGRGGKHTIYYNNGSEFVLSAKGDTYRSIAAEFSLSLSKITKFNDVDDTAELGPAEMVYIMQKNKRSENGKLIHIAKDGETLQSISQLYGIRLQNLCNINRRSKESEVKAGQQIRLM